MATIFSKNELNFRDWNGVADLTIPDRSIQGITVTGNPAGVRKLILPETQSTTTQESQPAYGYKLVINDPNGYFTSTGLLIEPSACSWSYPSAII